MSRPARRYSLAVRPAPGPAGQARVLGIQQAFGSEPVQMEFRLVARDADGVGRLVSAHRHRL
ncbi:Uncharacterised protein [Mycobacterium tuberculosis]|nr:Uncharacterised protein [Mycobacterium tuberculosis]